MDDSTVSIILDTTDSTRNRRQKAITNISPVATNNQILQFANAVNALTTDTLDKVTRVEKQIIEHEDFVLIGSNNAVATYNTQQPTLFTGISFVLLDTRTNTALTRNDVQWSFSGNYDRTKIAVQDYTEDRIYFFQTASLVKDYQQVLWTISATYNEYTYSTTLFVQYIDDSGSI